MTLANTSSELKDSLFRELSAVGQAISAVEHYLVVARQRQAELTGEIERKTERVRAVSTPSKAPYGPSTDADRCRRGFDYRGVTVRCLETKDIWIGLMQRLLNDFPDKHTHIVKALRAKGRSRCYLSRDRTALYENKDSAWIMSHSVELENGWYLDKNFDSERMLTLLRTVVQGVGLTWNADVTVRLRTKRAQHVYAKPLTNEQ